MGSGRITLDFNPPLAGKTLVYEITVNQKLETIEEKISNLIHRRIPAVDVVKFNFKVGKDKVKLNMPPESFYIEGIQLAKRGVAMDIQRFLPNFTTVKFVESFIKPGTEKKSKKKGKSTKKVKSKKKTVKKIEKAPTKKNKTKTVKKTT
jgi:peptidylprolyl isomerase